MMVLRLAEGVMAEVLCPVRPRESGLPLWTPRCIGNHRDVRTTVPHGRIGACAHFDPGRPRASILLIPNKFSLLLYTSVYRTVNAVYHTSTLTYS